MDLMKKIKAIRLEEGMNQAEFAQLLDISIRAVQSYEQETRAPSGEFLMKITNNEKLKKYALWLVTGSIAPDSGQICPAFSTQEECGLIENQDAKRA